MDLQARWGMVSRNHQGGANSVSQVDGVSDMTPTCQLCGDKAQQRNNGFCQPFCLGQSCPSSSCPDARHPCSSTCIPGAFEAASPELNSEELSLSKSVCRTFKRNFWDSRNLSTNSATIPGGFYGQNL